MKKVEQYIKEHTNRYSNHVELAANITGFTPWLTVDDAKHVAKIAREETIKQVCEWLENNVAGYCVINDTYDVDGCIEDLKKHLEDKV